MPEPLGHDVTVAVVTGSTDPVLDWPGRSDVTVIVDGCKLVTPDKVCVVVETGQDEPDETREVTVLPGTLIVIVLGSSESVPTDAVIVLPGAVIVTVLSEAMLVPDRV